jgi:hypothetical protein
MAPKTTTKTRHHDHGVLAYGAMQYNHGALRLDAVQKGQIMKFLQILVYFVLKF